jgi:hypothetical protein
MVKKGVVLHNFSHFLLPFLIFLVIIRITPKINQILVFIVVWAGSLLPDLDHINIWRKTYYRNLKEFLRYCLSSDRYRRSFLVFHNVLAILILLTAIPIASILNIFIGIFLLAILSHLVLDFFTDGLLIKTHGHWKFRSWI